MHSATVASKVHAIQTGLVRVKRAFRTRAGGPGPVSKIRVLIDPKFTDWLPIWTWLIEHPEGNILVDTGERAAVMQADYFRVAGRFSAWLNRSLSEFRVEEKDEIGPQLETLGFGPREIRWVILTHLHLDHTGGLQYFPANEILVNELEWRHPFGSMPQLYPPHFKPSLFQFEPDALDGFDRTYRVTSDGAVLIVPTPGHTYHHVSVLLRNQSDETSYLFAGDAVYHQAQLVTGEQAGAHVDYTRSTATYGAIRNYARRNPTVLLPSHDRDAGVRLAARQALSL